MTIDLPAPERQQRLLRYIEQQQRITVNQIATQFDVSLATARRDLEVLADQGKVQRVHGGAIAVRQAAPEPPVLQRAAEQFSEKVASDVQGQVLHHHIAILFTDGLKRVLQTKKDASVDADANGSASEVMIVSGEGTVSGNGVRSHIPTSMLG